MGQVRLGSYYSTLFNCGSGTIIFLGEKIQVLRPYLMVVRLTKIAVVVVHENPILAILTRPLKIQKIFHVFLQFCLKFEKLL